MMVIVMIVIMVIIIVTPWGQCTHFDGDNDGDCDDYDYGNNPWYLLYD